MNIVLGTKRVTEQRVLVVMMNVKVRTIGIITSPLLLHYVWNFWYDFITSRCHRRLGLDCREDEGQTWYLMSPCDFWVFSKLKEKIRGCCPSCDVWRAPWTPALWMIIIKGLQEVAWTLQKVHWSWRILLWWRIMFRVVLVLINVFLEKRSLNFCKEGVYVHCTTITIVQSNFRTGKL